MNRKMLLWLLIGWLIALVIPPSRIVGMFGQKRG